MKKHSLLALSALALLTLSASGAAAHCGSCGHGAAANASAATPSPTASASSGTAGTAQAEKPSLLATAKAGGFTILVKAVEAAGLSETLDAKGPFTVFAPTDEAFAKLPAGTLDALLKDPEALKAILLHHVVAGSVMAADALKLESAKTIADTILPIKAGKDGVFVGAAKVIKTDISAGNGVIHVIDSLLLP